MATPAISNLRGTGYKQLQLNRLNPQQQQLFSQASGALSPNLSGIVGNLGGLASGDQSQFDQLEAPALRQFAGIQGNLASRFSGMGSGARRSSGFNLASEGAAQSLAESLQSQRLGLQQSAIEQLLGLYGSLMGTDTQENQLIPKKQPAWQSLLSSLSPGIGQGIGNFGTMGLGRASGLY